MIELFMWLFGILIVSLCCGYIYRKYHARFFIRVPLSIFAIFGVFIHEVAHFVILNLFGIKTQGFSIHFFGDDGFKRKASPHGSVGLTEDSKIEITFLQALLGGIAPLVVCTFLFMFCLDIIFHMVVPQHVTLLAIYCATSLLIGSSPSWQDIKNIGWGFNRDLHYSLYQLSLVLLSLVTVFFLIDTTVLMLPFELLYYMADFIAIVLGYFFYKYIFLLIKMIYNTLSKTIRVNPVRFTRKGRFNPKKPPRKERKWW